MKTLLHLTPLCLQAIHALAKDLYIAKETAMIVIRVLSKHSGNPKSGVRVMIIWNFFTHTDCGYTDENGYAYADVTPRSGELHVGGNIVYEGHLEGMIPVYV